MFWQMAATPKKAKIHIRALHEVSYRVVYLLPLLLS